ncbi:MAG: hypothetical protein EOM63_03285 [Clostridia bacterium]|nr:hypothetical protein [Clostridia bacterium]
MRETAFPRWQFALTALFVLADALYLPASPHALWLALPAAGLIVWPLLWLACRVFRGHDPLAGSGMWSRLLAALLAVLAMYAALGSALRLVAFWHRTTFPLLPTIVSFVLLVAAGMRLARAGTVHLTMWALPTLIAVLVPLALSLLLTAHDWRVSELLPLLPAHGFGKLVVLCLRDVYLPACFPFLLLLGREKPGKAAASGVLFASVVLSATAARNLMLLGAGTASRIPYPTFASAGLVAVGDFFQRGEALIAGCLTLCELARLAVLFLVAARGLRTAFLGFEHLLKHKKQLSR